MKKPTHRSLMRLIRTVGKQFLVSQFRLGQARSAFRSESIDALGDPIPWFTYPAVEFLKQFDFSSKRVFEWGSGNSTLFWARRASEVTAVEDNEDWYREVQAKLPQGARIHLQKEAPGYVGVIDSVEDCDVIVIDGTFRWDCALVATKHLAAGGMIIVDNSWGHPGICAHLGTTGDLIQVDFIGFTPVTGGLNSTSIFLSRDFAFPSRDGLRPWIQTGGPARPDWISPENWR